MVGWIYLLLYLFYQAERLPDDKTRRPAFALTYCFDHVILFLEDINYYQLDFVAKNDLSPYKIFV